MADFTISILLGGRSTPTNFIEFVSVTAHVEAQRDAPVRNEDLEVHKTFAAQLSNCKTYLILFKPSKKTLKSAAYSQPIRRPKACKAAS